MDMIEHFHRLFAYYDWANREVLAALRAAEAAPPRSLNLMSHILSAERLWLERRVSLSAPISPCRSVKPKPLNCPSFGRITWMQLAKPTLLTHSITGTAKAKLDQPQG
jgi:hypothetical protein